MSTLDQSTDNQVEVLTAWAVHRNFEVIEVYQEHETAWRSGQQKELQRLILDGQRRKFQVVLVWVLDRLSREGALKILTLINNLNTWGIKVLSHQELWTEAPNELSELLYALPVGWHVWSLSAGQNTPKPVLTDTGITVIYGVDLKALRIRGKGKGNGEDKLCLVTLSYQGHLGLPSLYPVLPPRELPQV